MFENLVEFAARTFLAFVLMSLARFAIKGTLVWNHVGKAAVPAAACLAFVAFAVGELAEIRPYLLPVAVVTLFYGVLDNRSGAGNGD